VRQQSGAADSKYTKPQITQLPKEGSCDEDTYANCVKVRSTPPSSSTLPPKQRVPTPIRYANPFAPLCMEPSPLDAYVCPLFDCSNDNEDHTSPIGVDTQGNSSASTKQSKDTSVKDKTPLWQATQSNMLRSTAFGAGLRKKSKAKDRLPCMDSYANVQPTVNLESPSIIQINHIQFNHTTNNLENPVQTIDQHTPRD
jgi:hypothetical protein